jgi:hypothetical protein
MAPQLWVLADRLSRRVMATCGYLFKLADDSSSHVRIPVNIELTFFHISRSCFYPEKHCDIVFVSNNDIYKRELFTHRFFGQLLP